MFFEIISRLRKDTTFLSPDLESTRKMLQNDGVERSGYAPTVSLEDTIKVPFKMTNGHLMSISFAEGGVETFGGVFLNIVVERLFGWRVLQM